MLRDEIHLLSTWVLGPVPESIPKAPGDGAFELVSIFPNCKHSLRRHDGRHNGFFDLPANATIRVPRGYSSVGRALDWQSRGQGFESPYLHFVVALTTFSLVRRRFLEERSCLEDVIHEFEGANRRPTALELAWLTRDEPCAPGRGIPT